LNTGKIMSSGTDKHQFKLEVGGEGEIKRGKKRAKVKKREKREKKEVEITARGEKRTLKKGTPNEKSKQN